MSTQINGKSLAEQIIDKIADHNGIKPENVSRDSMLQEDLGMDSLDVIDMTYELEKRFNVSFEDEKVERFGTVGDVISFIEERVV